MTELADVLEGYLDLRWRINPVEGTYVGRREFDSELPRLDPASLREYAAALRSYAASLEEVEAPSLDDEIDRTATLHAARHDLLVLEREKPHARNPTHALLYALNGIHLLLARDSDDPARRGSALLARLQAMPRFLDEAAAALTEPRAVFLDTARAMIAGGVSLLRDGLAKVSLPIDPIALAEARDAAIDALHRYGDALALMEPAGERDFGIGRELFDLKLHTAHMIRENADELLRFGERLRAEAIEQLERLAAELRPNTAWRDVVRFLREDTPTRDTAVDEYRSAMRAALDFTVERGLVTVPDGELLVSPTPDFLRALIPFAAYQGPAAFDGDARGTFFVTLPQPHEAWRLHCRAELPSTALHEGIPGHHLQIVTACALPRPVRRVLSSPAAQEGWALYCENLMAEQGFISDPAARFFQVHHLLWRALRVILDVSLHTKGMTVDTAAAILRDELGLEESAARSEAVRYCAFPTYQLCYALGRREILSLRDDAREARGAMFSLRAFHDELLSYGALPTPLARWGMGLA
ncbi:MAG TPA: DUF885 domain-containing protein [Gemmatimonadaceae bacterium]|nr:DUF885 domain-containing protein [Gemmatimonadaceae bacterium]